MNIKVLVGDNTSLIGKKIMLELLKNGVYSSSCKSGYDSVRVMTADIRPEIVIIFVYDENDGAYSFVSELKSKYPEMAVLTCVFSSDMNVHRRLVEAGAAYSFYMPINRNLLMEHIIEILCHENKSDFAVSTELFLKSCGFPNKLKGFRYLSAAIGICIEEPAMLSGKITEIYERIGEKCRTKPYLAERSLRNLTETAYRDGKVNMLSERKPTNGELICMVCDEYIKYLRQHFVSSGEQ